MKPTAFERLAGRLLVLQIALHYDVAAEHDLTDGFAVAWHRIHCGRIEHRHIFFERIGYTLTSLELRAFVGGQVVPTRLLRANRSGAVHFGQPVDMSNLDPDAFGTFQHCNRRRGTRDQSNNRHRGLFLWRVRRVDHRVVDDRRAAHVCDAVLRYQLKYLARINFAQAHVDAGRQRDCPRKTPAVAMKHRQGPKVNRMLPKIAGKDITDGVQIRAAMMRDDTFWIACGAGRVAERNGVPFVLHRCPVKIQIARRDRVFVFNFANPLATGKG